MKLLKNERDIKALENAVSKCKDDVILRSCDGSEEYNLKSLLSRFIGIGKLCEGNGDSYEIFCASRSDEGNMLNFFRSIAA